LSNNLKKKVIIVYASAGAGHFKAAEAIYNYIQVNCKDTDIALVDVLKKTNRFFTISYIWGYSFLVNHVVFLWRFSFWLTSFRMLRPLARLLNSLNSRDFITFLNTEQPDFFISTHFLPSEIACGLKNKGKINAKIITVITDFGVHPFWTSEGTDQYIVASGFTKEQLLLKGVDSERVKVLGIPVHPKFYMARDKNILSGKLGINKDKFTVLIITGSFGIGPIEQIVDLLHDDLQLLVVCARNKILYGRLKKKNYAGVFVYGFVDNVEELMAVSDIIVTKPGGLSSAEILVSELVPIFIHPIPGQETENIRALASYGIGVYAKNLKEIKEVVLDYKKHPEKINSVKNNIKELKKSFLPQELAHVVC